MGRREEEATACPGPTLGPARRKKKPKQGRGRGEGGKKIREKEGESAFQPLAASSAVCPRGNKEKTRDKTHGKAPQIKETDEGGRWGFHATGQGEIIRNGEGGKKERKKRAEPQ